MKPHPFDPISFIFGALLLALGVLIVAGEASRLVSAWLAPTLIIGLGVLLLIAAWHSSRTSDGGAAGEESRSQPDKRG